MSCSNEERNAGRLSQPPAGQRAIEAGNLWLCRSGLALNHLEAGRRVHLQSHCQCCCHHSGANSDRQPLHAIGCQSAISHAKQDRVGRQIAPGRLSFLQPPCPATMAREQHPPFEWSLLMRAFASWKVCKAYWRPRTAGYARHSSTMQVSNL